MTQQRWREAIGDGALAFLFLAAFLRWQSRLGRRGLVAYVAVDTALGFALRAWLIHYLKRTVEEQERARERLRQQLGREPTVDELVADAGSACKR